ncbi:MBL fold metallo-hydrolase [Aerolutibacter ruishenii]|uniref:MBL fold metallo-hydrolase n=1 Tax=Aerolutibacter ruishenii TaxID=686800 RepID=UPI001F5509F5|nr:MBL fold metallo-hydrolase [Lysobacter ruishenii]
MRNRARFNFDPASINVVLLTHAHIDHSGLREPIISPQPGDNDEESGIRFRASGGGNCNLVHFRGMP